MHLDGIFKAPNNSFNSTVLADIVCVHVCDVLQCVTLYLEFNEWPAKQDSGAIHHIFNIAHSPFQITWIIKNLLQANTNVT